MEEKKDFAIPPIDYFIDKSNDVDPTIIRELEETDKINLDKINVFF